MIDEESTKEEVLEAVKNDGWALEFASEELKNDRELVLEAVKQDGMVLKYASDNIIADAGKLFAQYVGEVR